MALYIVYDFSICPVTVRARPRTPGVTVKVGTWRGATKCVDAHEAPAAMPPSGDDPNRRVITQAERARQKAEQRKRAQQEAAAKAPPTVSKTVRRKLAQIEARKQKEASRSSVLASLAAHQVSAGHLQLLGSSGTLGHKATKRQRLQRSVHARNEGVELAGLEPLEVEQERPSVASDESGEEDAPLHSSAAHGASSSRMDGNGGANGLGGGASPSGGAAPSGSAGLDNEDEMADDDEMDDAYWASRAVGFGQAAQILDPTGHRAPKGRKRGGGASGATAVQRASAAAAAQRAPIDEATVDVPRARKTEARAAERAASPEEEEEEEESEEEEEEGEEEEDGEEEDGEEDSEGSEAGEEGEEEEEEGEEESEDSDEEEEAGASSSDKPLSAVARAILAMMEGQDEAASELQVGADAGSLAPSREPVVAAGPSGKTRGVEQMRDMFTRTSTSGASATAGASGDAAAFYVHVKRPASIESSRAALPIYAEEQVIMEAVHASDVLILCGETGSGKTTQLPQFLYEAGYAHPGASGRQGMVGITQPRRVAAVSMAQRVAHELCTPLGGDVAYQVRYDSTVGAGCRIKFMTDGVLLREISSDLLLSRYSVIVIDEAHERGVNTDLLLGLLSRVVKMRRDAATHASTTGPLKLIIMSATLQVETFRDNRALFESPPPVINVEARQHPVTSHFSRRTADDHLEAAYKKVAKIHANLPAGGILVFLTGKAEIDELCARLTRRYAKQRTTQPEIMDASAESSGADGGGGQSGSAEGIDTEAAEQEAAREFEREAAAAAMAAVALEEEKSAKALLESDAASTGRSTAQRSLSRGAGDGWLIGEEAEAAADVEGEPAANVGATESNDEEDGEEDDEEEDSDEEDGIGGPVLVLPLYSMLPASEQMRVWAPPPAGTRLIVVATNVAETSITIPNITYVVDCGKVKQRTYSESSAVSRFELEWISQASADQRAGRAGRVGPGHCYRLYSSSVFSNVFPRFAVPEIRREPVESLVLQMKAIGIARVASFPFPEPPPAEAVREAERALEALGATAAASSSPPSRSSASSASPWVDLPVSSVGRLLARLPISPRIGKFLLTARRDKLLALALPLAAMLAQPDPFAHSHGGGGDGDGDGDGDDASPKWVCKESDALCLLGEYLRWQSTGADEAAAHSCALVHKVMREAEQLASQLARLFAEIFPSDPPPDISAIESPDGAQAVALRRALAAACPDRIARLVTLTETPAERKLVATAGKDLPPPLLRRAYVAADHASDRLIWLPTDSPLGRLRPRPGYIAFLEIVAHGKRPRFARASAIDPAWLVEITPALIRLSPPILEPMPRYDAAADATLCWQTPTYGHAGWTLPVVPRPPPRTPAWLPAALFGRALCAGLVFKGLRVLATALEPRARMLTSTGATDKAALALRDALVRQRIESRSALVRVWAAQPRALLREIAALLEESRRPQLVELWPRMLVLAEQAQQKAAPAGGATAARKKRSRDA